MYSDRFDETKYDNDVPCIIGLFDKKLIDETCIEVPERLLTRLINVGHAYNLHLISLFDIYNDTYLNRQQCENLIDELNFVDQVVNDKLLHKLSNKIKDVATDCIRKKDSQLLISGN